MKPKKRQKLCHNCEGEIDIDVIVCPFCAADLREEKPEQRYGSFSSQVQHMGGSPSFPHIGHISTSETISASLKAVEEEVEIKDVDPLEQDLEKPANVFLPTILFTVGVQLFVFGLLMLLFSHKGVVLLKWDARFWFLYLFAATPFLVFGYKSLSKL